MFSLGQGINYFDKDEVLDNEYFKEYLTIKNSDSLSKNSNNEDLFFFNPEEFGKMEKVYSMNQYMLADYMDILYLDEKSNKKEINKTVSYFEKYENIFNSLLKDSSIKESINFKYGQKINKLIENFKSDLLNSDIDEMYISSGSVHAMKYSLVFDILTKEEKEKIKQNLKNRKITIIYGPFALLEDDNNNRFIKFLFEELDNDNISIQRDNNNEYKRIHFSYKKYKDGRQTITIETPHREYLMRRNYIELDIKNYNFNDFKNEYLFINDNTPKDATNIKSYEEFIKKDFRDNLKDYFAFYNSSNRYLYFKKAFKKYKLGLGN